MPDVSRGDLSASLGRVGSGYLLAVIPGVALGLASGRESRSGEPAFTDYQRGTRRAGISRPPGSVVAWHRLPGHRVPWIALAGFFFRPTSTRRRGGSQCLRYSPERRMLGFGRRAIFFRVVIPSAMPQVFAVAPA